jgi:hypothetical protein
MECLEKEKYWNRKISLRLKSASASNEEVSTGGVFTNIHCTYHNDTDKPA